MIKGIFCHDLPIFKDVNGVYCSTTLTNDIFSRYLNVVDELLVATRVYTITNTYSEAHQEKIDLPGLRFLDLPNVNKTTALFKEIPQAKKLLRKAMEAVDLVFIRGGTVAMLGASIARKLHKPYLLECGGCAWDSLWNHSLKGKLVAPYYEYRAKKDAKKASHVLYVTQKWLQNRYPSKGISIGVSDVFIEDNDVTLLENRFSKITCKSVSDPFILGTAAGLVKYKRQQDIIKVIAKLKDKFNLRYEIVGGGDETYLRNVAKKYGVAERVLFKGQLKHAEILEWMKTIDLYAQPSFQEGLPRALVEAMSCACPAIGSNIAGIPELLQPEMIFKAGDVNGICKILMHMDEQTLRQSAEYNFKKAKDFLPGVLDVKRKDFFTDYKNFVLGNSVQ